jgi:hypothetical protein
MFKHNFIFLKLAGICAEALGSTMSRNNKLNDWQCKEESLPGVRWVQCISPHHPKIHHLLLLMTKPIRPLQFDEVALMFQVAVLMPKKHRRWMFEAFALVTSVEIVNTFRFPMV